MPESGRRAGSPVSVYMCEYNDESPKQDRKRFNSIVKTINIADLGIIYLWSTLYTIQKSIPKQPYPYFIGTVYFPNI